MQPIDTAIETPLLKRNDGLYTVGWIILLLTAFGYIVSLYQQNKDFSAQFVLNYLGFLFFFGCTLFESGGIRFRKLAVSDHRLWIQNVIILTFSALSLNTSMEVFSPFPIWMNLTVVSMMIALLVFPYWERLPQWGKCVLGFVQGGSWLMCLYLIAFIGPLHAIAIPLILFLGISIHTFVPLFWLIMLCLHIKKYWHESFYKQSVLIGFLVPILALSFYLYRWHHIQKIIQVTETNYNSQSKYQDLPQWVVLSQHLPDDILTETIVTSPSASQRFDWGGSLNFTGSQRRYHNPFAMIAMGFFGEINLDNNTLIHLLESKYDARHDTHRRLWSGNNLSTKSIATNAQIFPTHRLAYIEKIITIHSNNPSRRRGDWNGQWSGGEQEAVYTFHLPEGSVMTSLSLWINGLEEKSRLTTRGKADSAYAEIVGRERKDPALMHWQEGNRVTVTVFPCTAAEDRIFKIGCTIPLLETENRLRLKSIWLEGPDLSETSEKIAIRFGDGAQKSLSSQPTRKLLLTNDNTYSGAYLPDWSLDFEAPPISMQTFDFQGNSYKMEKWTPGLEPFQPQEVVLDVTNEWSSSELENAFELFKNQKKVAFFPEKKEVKSPEEVAILRHLSFNMLPLYDLNPSGQTLVVTKTGAKTPFISDLETKQVDNRFSNKDDNKDIGTRFSLLTKHFFKGNDPKIRVFDLSEEKSAYWQSLRAIRLIQYTAGTMNDLKQIVLKRRFPILDENENRMVIPESGVCITRTAAEQKGQHVQVPDHLLRLYAYNDLMRLMGKDFFDKQKVETKLVRKAEEAYIVSPISSLIVLESQSDYDRMGIGENKNSLGNAHIGNKGAVPEPHEWALLALIAGLVWWQYRKQVFL
ncbi:MAG: hypothetical protein RL329_571 [Bacteroidota bacterium]